MAAATPPEAKRSKLAAAAEDEPRVIIGGREVAPVGLGCLPAGVGYPDASKRPLADVFHAMVVAAAKACAPLPLFIDLADTYCYPHSRLHGLESDLGTLLKNWPADLPRPLVSTKMGMIRISEESSGWRPRTLSAAIIRESIIAAKEALGQAPFLWSLHHVDALRNVPGLLEELLRVAAESVAAGLIERVGLCNASTEDLVRAMRVVPIAAVQNEWNFWCRDPEKVKPPGAATSSKKGVLSFCACNNIAFVGHSPLGGLKARRGERQVASESSPLTSIAKAKGVSVQAVTLTAMRLCAREVGAVNVVLIPGARTVEHASDSCASRTLTLSEKEMCDVMKV